jgi:hypothetical protein
MPSWHGASTLGQCGITFYNLIFYLRFPDFFYFLLFVLLSGTVPGKLYDLFSWVKTLFGGGGWCSLIYLFAPF